MAASRVSSNAADHACLHLHEGTKLMALARRRALAAIALILAMLPNAADAVEFIREDIRVPMPAAGPHGLEGIVVRTDEAGRHPLVLINHGAPRDAAQRPEMSPFQYYLPAVEFARRGFTAAIVMRRGFGDSGGGFQEAIGPCNNTNYVRSGSTSTADLSAAIAFLAKRPGIDGSRIMSVGHSAGGFATVALTAAPPAGLVSAISFAGGRGSDKPDSVCQADRQVAAFAEFGKRSRTPMLWVYAENDHFFGPALAERFRAAFTGAGGVVKAAAFADDGHSLFAAPAGIPIWTAMVDDFLKAQNLVLRSEPLPPPTPPDIAPPPQLSAAGRNTFAQFLAAAPHRAFAVSPSGQLGWAAARRTVEAAKAAALGFCQPTNECRVVAVDDAAVP
jgi:dienelactone hydrolase